MSNSSQISYKILRLVIKAKYDPSEISDAKDAFKHLLNSPKSDSKYKFLITPGGFLCFEWPSKYQIVLKDQKIAQKRIPTLRKMANDHLLKFWNSLSSKMREKIQTHINYITFGIDSHDLDENERLLQGIQFVALFNTKQSKVIRWTGKSYPTIYEQKSHLIEIPNLQSHFVKVNRESVCLLGCHDLKMFSPRSKALARNIKKKKIQTMDKLMKSNKPNIILHHPHYTDTYKIWNAEWRTIEKKYPFVNQFVSGIRYYNEEEQKRGDLKTILKKCSKGSVVDIKY